MMIDSLEQLLKELLTSTKPSEVQRILHAVGDTSEFVAEGQPFGDFGLRWRFYGGKDSNLSTVNIAQKPGRSLTERVTNAIDALIERRMLDHAGTAPASPMDAAGRFFGRPPTTADNGLFAWKEARTGDYDRRAFVVLTTGDRPERPSVDVLDHGIGIRPRDFGSTILSLQEGNKITKPYLIGSFGQGGAASVGFCKYTLIVSRYAKDPQSVGFTIVRQAKLPSPYQWPAFVYLALEESVPSVAFSDPLDLYPFAEERRPPPLESGTLVRHFGYSLEGLENTLSSSPGNLYHLLQYMLFDPLLPFRVVDLSENRSKKDERISGSRNRLMQFTVKGGEIEEEPDEEDEAGAGKDGLDTAESTGTQLRHHYAREMVSPATDETPSIGIEYWVPLNYRKYKGEIGLRKSSTELYVDRNHPIVGTLNGQNHGEITGRILRELGLTMVSKHMVVHIDATAASSEVRQALFSSTREGFRDGEVLNELTRVLTNMLQDDAELLQIERELTEAMLKKSTSETSTEVTAEIRKLLRNAGFKLTEIGAVVSGDGDEPADDDDPKPRPVKPLPPLPTLPYPQVTTFQIVSPPKILRVPKGDNRSVRIETDASFRFDREKRIAVRSAPGLLEVASKSDLKGGRMHWRLRAVDSAGVGDKGTLTATITKPDGSQLAAHIPFEILEERDRTGTANRGKVPAFSIRGVHPDEDVALFQQLWGDVGMGQNEVAYKVMKSGDELRVFYSLVFTPYEDQMERLKKKADLASYFDHHYRVWIGYHAIIQYQQRSKVLELFAEDEKVEEIQERERAMVAEVQVKQGARMAELSIAAAKGRD